MLFSFSCLWFLDDIPKKVELSNFEREPMDTEGRKWDSDWSIRDIKESTISTVSLEVTEQTIKEKHDPSTTTPHNVGEKNFEIGDLVLKCDRVSETKRNHNMF